MKIRHLLYVALVVGTSAVLAPIYGPGLSAYAAAPAPAAATDDLDKDLKSVAAAFALVEKNFADPVTSEKAFYQGAIPGMLHTLDPHSNFVDPDDYREMQRRQRAQYAGVGMEIISDSDGHTNVMRPFVGSPAYNAGFRRGDIIEAVDGKDVSKMDSSGVANLLRGPRGTQVRVTMKRDGAPDFISAEVTRGSIETSVVDAFWVTPEVIYLRVDNFEASNLSHDVEADLKKLGETKAKGLILDLRYNPGGLVNEAVALAGRWLKDGQVVVSHHGLHEEEQVFRARSVATGQKYPMVVLVNSQSASASEIVSGALQDHDRAWLIGDTTFGKGLVQAQFPLSEGAALLLTIAHYYTPSGRLIQRDYSHESYYDYLYTSGKEAKATQDVKSTDSGRKVFGGGGITPDEKYANPTFSPFQRRMGVSLVTGVYPGPIYRFANSYFGAKKPSLPEGWEVGSDVLEQFRAFLKTQQKQTFTDAEFDASKDFLKHWIRWEFYYRAFDKETADHANWKEDPEIQKGIQSIPKAQGLLQQVQRVMAERGAKG
ncbi:MAG TPA: S41 family peptidase [Bryobacteraceae bacterium]|jgi:carboxyl-terminal processing protease|nr:S41 family peptidase [Bryobacteraceae bacterium]